MAKGKLVIGRHGQTHHNIQNLMTGQLDVPLTEEGEEQGREMGRIMRSLIFNKVYSSTLVRAFNTAALALEHSGSNDHFRRANGAWDIEQRKEIMEVDSGDFTGRNHKTDPEILNWKRTYETPLPGGESDRQVVERVERFYRDYILPRLEKGENVLVVAHAGILRAFDIVLGLEVIPQGGIWSTKKRIPNATPTVYEYEDGILVKHYQLENSRVRPPDAANQNTPPQAPKFGG